MYVPRGRARRRSCPRAEWEIRLYKGNTPLVLLLLQRPLARQAKARGHVQLDFAPQSSALSRCNTDMMIKSAFRSSGDEGSLLIISFTTRLVDKTRVLS